MIVLDRDVLAKIAGRDPNEAILSHLGQYRREEWTIPAVVAWESYKAGSGRTEMLRTQRVLDEQFDRVLDFTDDCALEAGYLDEQLRAQGIRLDPADLLNLATAHAAGGTFVTHNATDFDKPPLYDLVDLDVVVTDS
ncbi:type II toxin-antitoxin system VapC family toxin [Halorhabdus sp. BNX81]|uniref:type II toxin-antitoxin system VapC family toxin n=1 Tax=Halorhabdus sp. BNX81 TaxID=2980181 RepID=UPI0023DCF934|nr:type II toxin-antitoxin system VapC family toxin [Halorhabdus sp. BNX81]WEL20327.1 PIN domain containing protein [Halorhabdus sp. BNX81]